MRPRIGIRSATVIDAVRPAQVHRDDQAAIHSPSVAIKPAERRARVWRRLCKPRHRSTRPSRGEIPMPEVADQIFALIVSVSVGLVIVLIRHVLRRGSRRNPMKF